MTTSTPRTNPRTDAAGDSRTSDRTSSSGDSELTRRAREVLAGLPKHLQWDIGLDKVRGEFCLPAREARALERSGCVDVLTKRRAKLPRVVLTDIGRECARLLALEVRDEPVPDGTPGPERLRRRFPIGGGSR